MTKRTFESVNREIEAINLDQLALSLNEGKRLKSISATSRICIVWKKVGGILKYLSTSPIPKKWKQALKILIKTMDDLCS